MDAFEVSLSTCKEESAEGLETHESGAVPTKKILEGLGREGEKGQLCRKKTRGRETVQVARREGNGKSRLTSAVVSMRQGQAAEVYHRRIDPCETV